MNIEAFCCAGLLTSPEALTACVSVLSEAEKAAVETQMAELRKLSRDELIRRWGGLREREWDAVLRRAREATGGRFDALPPYARQWIVTRLADGDGREDSQA